MRTQKDRFVIIVLLVVSVGGIGSVWAQDQIKKHQRELENIREQIQEYERKISEQQQHERAALDLLDSYDRKGTLVRKLISKLKADEKAIQDKIDVTKKELDDLEHQLNFLREQYAHYVSSVYKTGRTHDLELLLSANSINQFYIRTLYLHRFTDQRRTDVEKIQAKQKQIEETQAHLHTQLVEERQLISEKGAEEDRLASLAAERKDVLARIRKDKNWMQREIDRQTKAAKELENVIANLIEAERIKKERLRDGRLPQPPPESGSFATKKGKLRWPVAKGEVVAKFGNHVHPKLKTITQNTGIDIEVPSGSPVTSVADGEVSTILWYPSYGNLLIVNHYDGYRTVYTHLAEIVVVEGQKVKEGDVIGTSGESIDGPLLHFELWKEREKQNPELWLAKQ